MVGRLRCKPAHDREARQSRLGVSLWLTRGTGVDGRAEPLGGDSGLAAYLGDDLLGAGREDAENQLVVRHRQHREQLHR